MIEANNKGIIALAVPPDDNFALISVWFLVVAISFSVK
jgi:hypothetical protein